MSSSISWVIWTPPDPIPCLAIPPPYLRQASNTGCSSQEWFLAHHSGRQLYFPPPAPLHFVFPHKTHSISLMVCPSHQQQVPPVAEVLHSLKLGISWVVSYWMLMSCQPHRVSSGQSNPVISKCTFQNSSHLWTFSQINPQNNIILVKRAHVRLGHAGIINARVKKHVFHVLLATMAQYTLAFPCSSWTLEKRAVPQLPWQNWHPGRPK